MFNVNSISEFHRLLALPEPLHPLVSVIRVDNLRPEESDVWEKFYGEFL